MDKPRARPDSLIDRRFEKKGLRPRVAASIIAALWLAAIVIFGIVQRLVDPDSFSTIWEGMWWATQTVTTVGYGDVVPSQPVGQLIGAILMIGGLSLFAVVTGTITSAFVTAAQEDRRKERVDSLEQTLDEIREDLAVVRAQLEEPPERRPPG